MVEPVMGHLKELRGCGNPAASQPGRRVLTEAGKHLMGFGIRHAGYRRRPEGIFEREVALHTHNASNAIRECVGEECGHCASNRVTNDMHSTAAESRSNDLLQMGNLVVEIDVACSDVSDRSVPEKVRGNRTVSEMTNQIGHLEGANQSVNENNGR